MLRFIEYKIEGVEVWDYDPDDDYAYYFKMAAMYCHSLTENLSDKEFEKWLKERKNGFTDADIRQWRAMYKDPVWSSTLSIMEFPKYCKSVIRDIISINKLWKPEKQFPIEGLKNTESSGIMELVVSFRKTDFSDDGMHLSSGRFIMELQKTWEEAFHNKFLPFYANAIEGHPAAMLRLTHYMNAGEETDNDFGMELINGEINIDANLEIEKFSKYRTVYAIGSMLDGKEDEPVFLVKNDNLGEEILVLKYVPDDDDGQDEEVKEPVITLARKK